MAETAILPNFIGGSYLAPSASETLPVFNPATGEILSRIPLSGAEDVGRAVASAKEALRDWRETPPTDRVQPLFRLKALLERDFEELSRCVTTECGKTLAESRGELRRAIENVEVACGIPSLMQGRVLEDIARGIDELMIRQPVGVVAVIAPFNFPAMIPFWFLPYALACGNTVVMKPSEKTPLTMQRVAALMEEAGFPPGVVQVTHGGQEAVSALLDHPDVAAVSFVGSSPVARLVYARAAGNGKRVQCQGGAKNPVVVLEDADVEAAVSTVAESAFGCAGQRCLAASLAITVGDAHAPFRERVSSVAASRVVGAGLDEAVDMGPVIRDESRHRIERLIGQAVDDENARAVVDGRGARIPGHEDGFFVRPTVLDGLPAEGEIARTEIFGPVLGIIRVDSVEDAIAFVNGGEFGNMACVFTNDGRAARRFRHEVLTGNVGINVGVAAPMAFFPFSGWRGSFFGDLHAQGAHAIEFYTQTKVVVERWPRDASKRF